MSGSDRPPLTDQMGTLETSASDYPFRCQAVIVPRLRADIILGQPWLQENRAVMDYGRGCLHVGTTERRTIHFCNTPQRQTTPDIDSDKLHLHLQDLTLNERPRTLRADIILGQPWLQENRAVMDYGRGCLHVGTTERRTIHFCNTPQRQTTPDIDSDKLHLHLQDLTLNERPRTQPAVPSKDRKIKQSPRAPSCWFCSGNHLEDDCPYRTWESDLQHPRPDPEPRELTRNRPPQTEMPACHDIAMGPGDWTDGQRQAAQATSGHASGQDGQRTTTSSRDLGGGKSFKGPWRRQKQPGPTKSQTVALGRASTPAVLGGPSLPLDAEKAISAAQEATCTTTGTDRAQDAQPRLNPVTAAQEATCTTTGTDRAQDAQPRLNPVMEWITAVPAKRSADQQGTSCANPQEFPEPSTLHAEPHRFLESQPNPQEELSLARNHQPNGILPRYKSTDKLK
ncbi:hypothetical protein QE152_g26293 [Popillia japonica]|uniref:Uncharacterized protein n=1 Tax=Popillia japonica TaxID=7064 RepID=A0AAW1JZ42_POPJA